MLNAQAPNPGSAPMVLLIDDSKFVHRLLSTRLRSESIQIHGEYDGQAGFDYAIKNPPALIMLDLDMPVMDGFETLRKLKDHPDTKDIPVIILSGKNSPQDKVTAFELGAVDFVTKPFELTELRARVRVSLQLHTALQVLAQKAMIDGLSMLYNRALFDQRWVEEFERGLRHKHPLSLVMLDIDKFKQINDNYGHPAGDAVITGIAKIILAEVRKMDIPCRYGGEEFAIILPDTAPSDAYKICERIRTQCENTIWPNHPGRAVTISIGIAGTSGEICDSAEEWVRKADQNLYAAKAGGNNRIHLTDFTDGTNTFSQAG
ncbi:MAG: diguanylate cyclase [Phycisphaerales bacterium]|nr:diguanylate cyclase [Phycisphaerales bacterium]